MALPEPQPGLVIRYAYLWRSEAMKGREDASKDRPCVVVIAVRGSAKRLRVYVAPITHTPPGPDQPAVEMPATTKLRLGLDSLPSWIVTNEMNSFLWTGPDIRFIDPRHPEQGVAYGYLPYKLTEKVLDQFRENVRSAKAETITRSE